MLISKRRVLTLLSASALAACAAHVEGEAAAVTPGETEGRSSRAAPTSNATPTSPALPGAVSARPGRSSPYGGG